MKLNLVGEDDPTAVTLVWYSLDNTGLVPTLTDNTSLVPTLLDNTSVESLQAPSMWT